MKNTLFTVPCLTTLFTACGTTAEPLDYGAAPEGSKAVGELDAAQRQLAHFAKKLGALAAEVLRIARAKDTELKQSGTSEEPDNKALIESLRLQYEGLNQLSKVTAETRNLMLNFAIDRSAFEGCNLLIVEDGQIVAVPRNDEPYTLSVYILGGVGGEDGDGVGGPFGPGSALREFLSGCGFQHQPGCPLHRPKKEGGRQDPSNTPAPSGQNEETGG